MKALLDTCVLLPASTREILLAAAAEGLFQPLWSPAIFAEWHHAAGRRGGATAEAEAAQAQAAAQAAFPTAMVDTAALASATVRSDLPLLPDPQDAHVLAASLAGGADVLITFNLRDFPRRPLAAFGITPRDPDGFLWELWSFHPDRIGRALATARRALPGQATSPDAALQERPVRAFLRRAGLPRLGRAMSS